LKVLRPAPQVNLGDYEAVGLSIQAACLPGIFSARPPLHPGL